MTTGRNGAPDDVWPFARTSPTLIADPIAQGLVLVVLASALFLAFPGLDPWFSGLFHNPDTGFPVGRLEAFQWWRSLARQLLIAVLVIMAAVVVLKIAFPSRPALLKPRDMLFVFSTLLIAPILIVNLILKANWHRPRPYQAEQFGGDMPFVGVWDWSGGCATNCSFTSGEASSAVWMLTFAIFLPLVWRRRAMPFLIGLAVFLSFNRIAFGGHFLSDVLISWGITLTVIAATHRLLYVHPPGWLGEGTLELALTNIGQALRQTACRVWRRLAARPDRGL